MRHETHLFTRAKQKWRLVCECGTWYYVKHGHNKQIDEFEYIFDIILPRKPTNQRHIKMLYDFFSNSKNFYFFT